MDFYESIIKGLSEAVDYQQGKITTRKTVEAWDKCRNKPEGTSRHLLKVVRDDPIFLQRFQI